MSTVPTAEELARQAKQQHPSNRYAFNRRTGCAVAGWAGDRWQMFAAKVINDRGWMRMGEVMVDGKPTNDPADWEEVFAADAS